MNSGNCSCGRVMVNSFEAWGKMVTDAGTGSLSAVDCNGRSRCECGILEADDGCGV